MGHGGVNYGDTVVRLPYGWPAPANPTGIELELHSDTTTTATAARATGATGAAAGQPLHTMFDTSG